MCDINMLNLEDFKEPVVDLTDANKEEFKPIDPLEFEKQELDKWMTQYKNPAVVGQQMLSMYGPYFLDKMKKLRHGQKTRLIEAIVTHPYQEEKFADCSKEELELQAIAQMLIQAKMLMLLDSMYSQWYTKLDNEDIQTEVSYETEEKTNE